MAKVKYTIKENSKVGTHSFYAVPVLNGSLDFMEVCEEACENTSIEPVGEQFLFVYPNIEASLKDKKDAEGNILEVATAAKFSLAGAKSRLGASVSPKYSAQFAAEVSWQRVDASGAIVEDEDITDNGTTPAPSGGGDTPSGGGDTPSGGGGGGGDDEPNEN